MAKKRAVKKSGKKAPARKARKSPRKAATDSLGLTRRERTALSRIMRKDRD